MKNAKTFKFQIDSYFQSAIDPINQVFKYKMESFLRQEDQNKVNKKQEYGRVCTTT